MKFISDARREVIEEQKPNRVASDLEFKLIKIGSAIGAGVLIVAGIYNALTNEPEPNPCHDTSQIYDASEC